MVGLVQRLHAVDLEDRALLQMVLQVAADARRVADHGDAVLGQPVARPDAGELQDLRRADGACRQDDLALGARLDEPAALAEPDADGAPAFDDHLLDQHAGLQAQVGPAEHGLQEGARRGPANAALLVDVEVADAGVVAGVEVGRLGDAHLDRGLGHGVQHVPLHARLLDPPFAAGAMMLGIAEEMIVEPLEDGPHIVPAPAGQAELAPVIVVLRPGRASRSWH